MKHIKKMKIDIDKKNHEVISSVQYDNNTRFLHINLQNGNEPLDITGCSVKISATKPDGTAVFNNCNVINAKEGFVEVELTEQINAAPGNVSCEIKIYDRNGVLTTKQFYIDVTASVTSKNITSGNEFKALEEALSKVNNIDTKFESLTAETVARATEKEIQKQIASGHMANLAIAPGSITKEKLDPNIKFGIEDGEVTNRKIADETITKEKFDPSIKFGVKDLDSDVVVPIISKAKVNLYKPGTGEPGYIQAATGNVMNGTRDKDWTSDFIACKPGETLIKAENSSNAINNQDICFFSKNKTYLTGSVLSKDGNWQTIQVPEGAYFFRFDMLATHKDTEKIYSNRGDNNITGYMLHDNIKVKGENLVDLEVGINQLSDNVITMTMVYPDNGDATINLFDKRKGEYGFLSNGDVLRYNESTKDWVSDFIKCKSGGILKKAENSCNSINTQTISFYNKDKNHVKSKTLRPAEDWRTIEVPGNAYFFRFDMLTTHKDTEKIYDQSDEDREGIEEYSLHDDIKIKGENLIDLKVDINQLSDNVLIKNVSDEYYLSNKIRIQKSNIIGMEDDDSTSEQISLYNEDGVKYLLTIDADGQLNVKPAIPNLPSNFNKFTTTGKSCMKGDILVTPHTDNQDLGWLIVLDSNLNIKKYKQISSFAYNFRVYRNSKNELRYVYCQTVNKTHPKMPQNGGYDNTKLVVADKNLNTLHEYYLKQHGTVPEGHPLENHEVIYFDDEHFIATAYVRGVVSNIPGKNGEYKALNGVIQEIKNGKVVFHWESINHVELYQYAVMNKDFTNYPNTQSTYNDYFHLNSVQVDPLNSNYLLVSSRFTGLMKIDKTTGNIVWMFGRGGRIDFKNMTVQQAPYLQHHMTRLNDGSIICFDNSGCATNNTRICRYWLDEDTMTMTKFKEYITKHPRSAHMGGVDMIREGVFLINYGGAYGGVTFEEYDFNLDKQNFSFKFNDGTDCYRVWKDI